MIRLMIPTILRMVIEEVRPIFAPHNFFDTHTPSLSVANDVHWLSVGPMSLIRQDWTGQEYGLVPEAIGIWRTNEITNMQIVLYYYYYQEWMS